MPPELAGLRIAVYELRSAAAQATAKKHGGDASRKWGKTKCIRGHDLYGPNSNVARANGKSSCLICAYDRRRKALAVERGYEVSKTGARLHPMSGKSQTVAEWAKEFNIKRCTVDTRMDRGMTLHKALTFPLCNRGTHCMRGHELTSIDLIAQKNRHLQCAICKERARKKRRKKRLKATGKRGN